MALEIPAINNEQCALAQHLGIEIGTANASELPQLMGESNRIKTFKYKSRSFDICHASKTTGAWDAVHEFNSNLWAIRELLVSRRGVGRSGI
jgi:hypothetical protein